MLRAALRPPTYAADTATTALVARCTSAPTSSRQYRMDRLLKRIASFWDKFEFFYVLAAKDGQVSLLDWKSGAHNLTASGSPVFATDLGYTISDAAYLSTGLASAGFSKIAQNNAHFGAFTTWAGNGLRALGTANSTPAMRLHPRNGNRAQLYICSTTVADPLVPYIVGHLVGCRDNSATIDAYKDGVLIAGGLANASTSLAGHTALLIGRSGNNYSTAQFAAVHAGQALTAGEVATLNAALVEYLAGLGWYMPPAPVTATLYYDERWDLPPASGSYPGEGFVGCGIDRAPDGTWWFGNHGHTKDSLPDDPHLPSIVHVSADFSTVLDDIRLEADLGITGAISCQGVAVDTSDGTIWAAVKDNNLIVHVNPATRSLIGTMGGTLPGDVNGLAYWAPTDQLVVSRASGSPQITWTGKSTYSATLSYYVDGAVYVDQLGADPAHNRLYFTSGDNGSAGVVYGLDYSAVSKYGELRIAEQYSLPDVTAIEGVARVGDQLYVSHDGFYHNQAGDRRKNRVLRFEVAP